MNVRLWQVVFSGLAPKCRRMQLGSRDLGFRDLGFRDLGFRDLGFRD